MVGAKKLYPSGVLVFPGAQEKKVRDFLQVYPVETLRIKDIRFGEVQKLIIVDTKKPDRIGPFKDLIDKVGTGNITIYDHHPFSEGEIRGGVEIVEEVGATATIITEIIRGRNIPLDPMEATILCLGIYEETGSLRFPSTTERDLMAVAYLLKRGANLNIISEFIRAEISREELDLLKELMESSRSLVVHGIRLLLCKAVRQDYIGDVAHLAHRIMDMEEIDAVIIMLSMEGKIVLIGRSRAPELNMAEVMEKFGGGGHPSAASATVVEKPLEIVEEEVINQARTIIRPLKVAADIMTRPVITIPVNSTIKEAESMMTRYGVNVLPVVRDDKYIGLISREVVEKALFHGFHQNNVSSFTTTDAVAARPDDSIREIEAQMIDNNQRFMAVLQDGNIIGAITRTDLLRSLYEDFLKRSRIGKEDMAERSTSGRNISSLLKEKFPRPVFEILKKAGAIAESLGFAAFLVGGSVRDLLMGIRNLDIDIVVEGDGLLFAQKLGEELGARVKTHERFSTAKVTFTYPDNQGKELTIDVATARTEYYESPAALPKVETSSIKKDLYRRDFTINTLSVQLNPARFGNLIDFFGGQRDIKDRVIRVLHNLSFVEDPTRAFRAVRFSERFGFSISKHTLALMKSALKLNLFDRLSGSRLYDELLLTFHETEPVKALKRLSKLNLLSVIHPNLRLTESIEVVLQGVQETLAWYSLLFTEDKPKKEYIYLMALLSDLNELETASALARLSAPKNVKEKMLMDLKKSEETIRDLSQDDPVAIYHALHGMDLETILYSMAICPDKEKQKAISKFLIDLRGVKPSITGNDLKKLSIPPGPLYAKILQNVLEEKLRGRLAAKEEELDYARELVDSFAAGSRKEAKI
jgi:tRNA nucleotidyltransferase (CCA-adding enzyme)